MSYIVVPDLLNVVFTVFCASDTYVSNVLRSLPQPHQAASLATEAMLVTILDSDNKAIERLRIAFLPIVPENRCAVRIQ